MPLQPGALLYNRYRIDALLGQGGFGAVYRAWDNNLGKAVALKENLEISKDSQRQFEREAMLLANLSHPNLPRVTDYFIIADQGQYLVMDFVEGKDLQQILDESGGRISEQQALFWTGQVCDAVGYLHSQNPPIIHRDIKPANIKVNPAGQAVLVDFGIAKKYDRSVKTTIGARAITPGYSPLEQYGQGTTDERTDLYALGATLYHLLTGLTPPESIQRMIRDSLTPVQQANPQVNPRTAAAVHQALQVDPARRFQTAVEFKQALTAAISQPVVQPQPAPAVPRPPAGTVVVTPAAGAPAMAPVAAPAARPRPVAPPSATSVVPMPQAAAQPSRGKISPWVWVVGIVGVLGLGLVGVLGIIGLIVSASDLGGGEASTTPAVAVVGQPSVTPLPQNSPTPAPPTPTPRFRSPDSSTYIGAVANEPDTLDPVLDYENSGGEILRNVYETLVTYEKDKLDVFVPQLATRWEISGDGRVYTFYIRQGVRFHDGSEMTAEDVAYSLRRGILQGSLASPQLLLTEPLFGVGIYDITELVDSTGSLIDDPAALATADPGLRLMACERVMEAIRVDPGTGTVRISLSQPWAPFLATLAGPWASVQSRAWVIANGGWNEDCNTWHQYYGRTSGELNKTPLGSQAMGTGPYRLDHWTPGQEIVLKSHPDYWRTEPAWPGGPVGEAAIKTVILKYVEEYAQRLELLSTSQVDYASGLSYPDLDPLVGQTCNSQDQNCTPTANSEALLEQIHGIQQFSRNDFFFTFQMSTQGGNPYLGSGRLDGKGVPADFFSDVHIRRAFSYCFNYDSYLRQVLGGEGVRTVNVMPPGTLGYDPTISGYHYDLDRCRQEFEAATLGDVMSVGFKLQLPFLNNHSRQQAFVNILKEELVKVNPKFVIEPVALATQDYRDAYDNGKAPIEYHGWIQDIPDPHNWVVPWTVMGFGVGQAMPSELVNQFKSIIDRGVAELDPARRAAIYQEFNLLYYEQAPVILTFMSMERRYQLRWVNGWYYHPANFGAYFYALWKD